MTIKHEHTETQGSHN